MLVGYMSASYQQQDPAGDGSGEGRCLRRVGDTREQPAEFHRGGTVHRPGEGGADGPHLSWRRQTCSSMGLWLAACN
jgi:hypothetical protein